MGEEVVVGTLDMKRQDRARGRGIDAAAFALLTARHAPNNVILFRLFALFGEATGGTILRSSLPRERYATSEEGLFGRRLASSDIWLVSF